MKSESADLVYSEEGPKNEIHLRVTTGDGKHVGEDVLKAHHLGADSIEAKKGILRLKDWKKVVGKVCTVKITVLDEGLEKIEVEFHIDGKWVADFHGVFEVDTQAGVHLDGALKCS